VILPGVSPIVNITGLSRLSDLLRALAAFLTLTISILGSNALDYLETIQIKNATKE
jgi:hypothetical protein